VKDPRPLLRRLQGRLRDRPDTEHEQALVRLAVGGVFFAYLLPSALSGDEAGALHLPMFVAMLSFMAAATLLFAAILAWPAASPARRIAGAILDSATASYFMVLIDGDGLPLYVVYLWITFGNGFRYGKSYLLNTLALCVLGFSAVLYLSPFWRGHLAAGLGLMVAMVAVSLYVLTLVKRLNEALQRAEAANLAKRQFVSTVSHEMRTPLNAIIGMLELLRDTPLNVEQAEMVKTVDASSRAMLGLVEDVLDFSKIEAGKVTIAKEAFDLYALCNSAMQVLKAQAEGKGVTFVSAVMPDVPPHVRGDHGHLRQVLINLLANAVKFTEQGSVTLHVSRLAEQDGVVTLKFSIRDTGIGIAPRDQQRIFESFTQADQGVTRRFGGTGLGTTIAKQLVDLLGGRIGVESAVGLGSTFWFELPLEIGDEVTSSDQRHELEGLDVLTVGFPAEALSQLQPMMTEWGARCAYADDVESAVRRVHDGAGFACALLYADELVAADGMYARLARELGSLRMPLVLCAPADSNVHRVPIVHGSYSAVLALPAEKRLVYNALHSFTAVEHQEGVVFLSDYLRKKGGARRLRVLVADDNAVNRDVLAKILERAGHATVVVDNGEQALDRIEREKFDAAILDRNMPCMGGIEAVRALRIVELGGVRLPVILLSADVTEDARKEAAEAGADLFLTKPVQASRLLESLLALAAPQSEAAAPTEGRVLDPYRASAPEVASVLNYETVTLLEGLGSRSDFMEKLIAVFIDDNAMLVRKIEEALEAKHFGEIRSLVHAMKGSAGSIGADRLAQACSQLQEVAEGDLRMRGRLHVGRLRVEFDAARGELTDYLRKRKSSTG
jgi:two-component system sensor histidine kinase RpfC